MFYHEDHRVTFYLLCALIIVFVWTCKTRYWF